MQISRELTKKENRDQRIEKKKKKEKQFPSKIQFNDNERIFQALIVIQKVIVTRLLLLLFLV